MPAVFMPLASSAHTNLYGQENWPPSSALYLHQCLFLLAPLERDLLSSSRRCERSLNLAVAFREAFGLRRCCRVHCSSVSAAREPPIETAAAASPPSAGVGGAIAADSSASSGGASKGAGKGVAVFASEALSYASFVSEVLSWVSFFTLIS